MRNKHFYQYIAPDTFANQGESGNYAINGELKIDVPEYCTIIQFQSDIAVRYGLITADTNEPEAVGTDEMTRGFSASANTLYTITIDPVADKQIAFLSAGAGTVYVEFR